MNLISKWIWPILLAVAEAWRRWNAQRTATKIETIKDLDSKAAVADGDSKSAIKKADEAHLEAQKEHLETERLKQKIKELEIK